MTDAAQTTTDATEAPSGGCGGACGCGAGGGGCGSGAGRVPVLDARPIDPAIRQAAILGVLVGLAPGTSALLVTEERPELALMLVEQQFPGQYEITFDEGGEGESRTKFFRVA